MVDYWDFSDEEKGYAELRIICAFIEAVPEIEQHLDPDCLRWEEWGAEDGMIFMGELLRVCNRLADDPKQAPLLFKVFDHLERLATKLESGEGPNTPAELDQAAGNFLLFTFTDNPTGKNPEFRKLSTFMGPKIREMCTIL